VEEVGEAMRKFSAWLLWLSFVFFCVQVAEANRCLHIQPYWSTLRTTGSCGSQPVSNCGGGCSFDYYNSGARCSGIDVTYRCTQLADVEVPVYRRTGVCQVFNTMLGGYCGCSVTVPTTGGSPGGTPTGAERMIVPTCKDCRIF
jgi:hypothetical protein